MATAQMSVMHNDYLFDGNVVCSGTFEFPDASITSAKIAASGIATAKLVHRYMKGIEEDGLGAATAVSTKVVHIARAAGTILALEAVMTTKPTGSDTVVVDVKRSTAGGAFATVLSSTITWSTASTVLVKQAATLNGALVDFIAGDLLEIVVTIPVSNTTGKGLSVTLTLDEAAQ
jgi:hypothetical protein